MSSSDLFCLCVFGVRFSLLTLHNLRWPHKRYTCEICFVISHSEGPQWCLSQRHAESVCVRCCFCALTHKFIQLIKYWLIIEALNWIWIQIWASVQSAVILHFQEILYYHFVFEPFLLLRYLSPCWTYWMTSLMYCTDNFAFPCLACDDITCCI